jgi:hypothetical protein
MLVLLQLMIDIANGGEIHACILIHNDFFIYLGPAMLISVLYAIAVSLPHHRACCEVRYASLTVLFILLGCFGAAML